MSRRSQIKAEKLVFKFWGQTAWVGVLTKQPESWANFLTSLDVFSH